MKIECLLALLVGVIAPPLHAQEVRPSEPRLSVVTARQGFSPAQTKDLRDRNSYAQVIPAGDVSLFHLMSTDLTQYARQIAIGTPKP